MNRLTEDLPSSGQTAHVCNWQMIKENADGTLVLACTHEGCAKTKLANKPELKESKGSKPLLFG